MSKKTIQLFKELYKERKQKSEFVFINQRDTLLSASQVRDTIIS